MNSVQQRKLNKYQAESAFMTDNAGDFPSDSPGEKAAKALRTKITEILNLAGLQNSQAARQNIGLKSDALDTLIKTLQKMNRAASAMAEEVDGIENLFRMPRRRSEEIWVATARAFHADSAPYDAQFQDYDLPATFRADLLAQIGAVETAASSADVATVQRGGAIGGLDAAFRDAGVLSRRLNAIVRNKYDNNPQKIAAWEIASHLEAPRKRSTNGNSTENPPAPTP